MDERGREREALLHAVRVRLGQLARPLGEAELREQVAGPPLELAAAEPVEAADEAQELARRELVVEEGMVRKVARDGLRGLGLAADVVAAEEHGAGRGRQQPGHQADGGRLAGSVRADEAEHGAGLDREVEVGDGDRRPVRLAQVNEADHRWLSSAVKRSSPTMPASSMCRSGPPSSSFTWVASVGSWRKTASALTHVPSQSSVQAW